MCLYANNKKTRLQKARVRRSKYTKCNEEMYHLMMRD